MNTNQNIYVEDEIDLAELWKVIVSRKKFIIIFTSIVTILSIVYALSKTPIYEVKSNVQVGYIAEKLVIEPNTLVKILNVVFNVEDKVQKEGKEFISEVTSITTNKKLKNFIIIKTEGISNEEALKKNKEVVDYIQNLTSEKIEQYIRNKKNDIKSVQINIKNLNELETKNLQRQIELLKNQQIVKIDEKIKRLKEQDIKKLQTKIELLKTQDIVKIDEQIKFYKTVKLPTLKEKIKFHTNKLVEYTKAVKKLYQDNVKTSDTTASTISSIQMVNYQNLILNSQNKIEDLKVEIEKINSEIIPNLERQKENIKNVTIKDLQLKIDNINNVTIKDLQRSKNNLQSDTLRKLEYQLRVGLPNKKQKLEEQIEKLKFQMSKQNIKNSEIIGEYVVKNHPVKPKKKLIVIVAFMTGLIFSIFIVFFLNFISKNSKEL